MRLPASARRDGLVANDPNSMTESIGGPIQIYKRADYNKEITKKNIKKLSKDGKVIVYSNTLSEVECLDRLVDRSIDYTVFFSNALSLPVDIFVKKLNKGLEIPSVSRIQTRNS